MEVIQPGRASASLRFRASKAARSTSSSCSQRPRPVAIQQGRTANHSRAHMSKICPVIRWTPTTKSAVVGITCSSKLKVTTVFSIELKSDTSAIIKTMPMFSWACCCCREVSSRISSRLNFHRKYLVGGQVDTEPTTSVNTKPRKMAVKTTEMMRICELKGLRQLHTSVRIKSSQVQRTKDLGEFKNSSKTPLQNSPLIHLITPPDCLLQRSHLYLIQIFSNSHLIVLFIIVGQEVQRLPAKVATGHLQQEVADVRVERTGQSHQAQSLRKVAGTALVHYSALSTEHNQVVKELEHARAGLVNGGEDADGSSLGKQKFSKG
ncbi:hypothetical protein TYRP_009471 [Tyrophagus putrescentiae]|nr:hypothetical protein TYRP_009471 [Tyrophagus putrescentiae]